ncbi:hypothetical protein ACFX1Q_023607 [Malus domestica]
MRVTYKSESPNATCTTGLAPTWIQGKLAMQASNLLNSQEIQNDQESLLRSSSNPIQDRASTALEELPPIQDQAPTALEESVHRSSSVHPKIKPQRLFGSTTPTNPHIQPFLKIKPKSLEDPFINCSSRSSPKGP